MEDILELFMKDLRPERTTNISPSADSTQDSNPSYQISYQEYEDQQAQEMLLTRAWEEMLRRQHSYPEVILNRQVLPIQSLQQQVPAPNQIQMVHHDVPLQPRFGAQAPESQSYLENFEHSYIYESWMTQQGASHDRVASFNEFPFAYLHQTQENGAFFNGPAVFKPLSKQVCLQAVLSQLHLTEKQVSELTKAEASDIYSDVYFHVSTISAPAIENSRRCAALYEKEYNEVRWFPRGAIGKEDNDDSHHRDRKLEWTPVSILKSLGYQRIHASPGKDSLYGVLNFRKKRAWRRKSSKEMEILRTQQNSV